MIRKLLLLAIIAMFLALTLIIRLGQASRSASAEEGMELAKDEITIRQLH